MEGHLVVTRVGEDWWTLLRHLRRRLSCRCEGIFLWKNGNNGRFDIKSTTIS